jgi:glutamine amidotransferase
MTAIAVVDYGMGNRRSVQKALEHVGARAIITSDAGDLRAADGLVVPGVGAFPKAMDNLRALGLVDVLTELAHAGKPLLGICLGMQLLFDRSEELGSADGLGLLAGEVRWLDARGMRIPHIGWNEVTYERESQLASGLPNPACPFYHVHSLAAHPADPATIVATCEYGERFATVVERGSVHGVQFHPEKSSTNGLRLLANFVGVCALHGAPASGIAAA